MQIFYLDRIEDESGISGTGHVADGVIFDDGVCVLHWKFGESTNVYNSIEQVDRVHGHGGKTKIIYAKII